MSRFLLLAMLSTALCSCSAVRISLETPVTLTGVVSQPTFTGWFRDYCRNGLLVDSSPDCLQHGGEVYRVKLVDVRTTGGARVAESLVIGFPAHALGPRYRSKKRIELVRAPPEFAAATGIFYFANHWNDI